MISKIHRQMVIWNQVTKVDPPKDRDLLVWTGTYMIVSDATYNDIGELVKTGFFNDNAIKKFVDEKGYFNEFGSNYYFDDPKVMWAELPLAPGEENPPQPDPMEGMVGKNVYLKKDGAIVGIHAVGDEFEGQFQQFEIWGNEYDDEHNMLGRGSFRVFDTLENEVKNWEADGWVQFEGPKKKT